MALKPEPSTVDLIIQALYRASAGELPFGEPLARIVELLDAWGVHLIGMRVTDGAVAFSYEVGPGFTAQGALDYLQRYHRIDPRVALVRGRATGEWVRCNDVFDDAFVARDPFYQEFLIPYGGRYVSVAKIHEDEEIVAFLGVHRGAGTPPLDHDELALCQRLGNHLGAALGLWRRQQRRLSAASPSGNALLDHLAYPVLLIDEQQLIHYTNGAARTLLGHDPRLRHSGDSLSLPDRGSSQALLQALRRLRLGGEGSFLEPGAPQRRAIVRARASESCAPLMLILLPVTPEETMKAFGPRRLAMVLVHDPAAVPLPDAYLIAQMYDLTPAEAQVAVAIAAGRSVTEIAVQRGISVTTVRTQLTSVFAKMGVSRQPELVSALASMPALEDSPAPQHAAGAIR